MRFHILDYEIYSDDLDGGLEVIDSDDEVSSDGEVSDGFLEIDINDRP